MAKTLGEGEGRLSAQQDAMLEQMISEKLTAISNRSVHCTCTINFLIYVCMCSVRLYCSRSIVCQVDF